MPAASRRVEVTRRSVEILGGWMNGWLMVVRYFGMKRLSPRLREMLGMDQCGGIFPSGKIDPGHEQRQPTNRLLMA